MDLLPLICRWVGMLFLHTVSKKLLIQIKLKWLSSYLLNASLKVLN